MDGKSARGGNVFRYVAVCVVESDVEAIRLADGEETADSAATLQSSVKVKAPDIVGRVPFSTSRTMLYPSQRIYRATVFVPAMFLETIRPCSS